MDKEFDRANLAPSLSGAQLSNFERGGAQVYVFVMRSFFYSLEGKKRVAVNAFDLSASPFHFWAEGHTDG